MKKNAKILLVDDDRDVLLAASLLLKQHFTEVHTSFQPHELPGLLERLDPDVIVLDMNFQSAVNSGNEGLFWLREIQKKQPGAVVVFLTAYGDVELAVKGLKEGATDFVLKPWQNEKFISTLLAAVRLREESRKVNQLKSKQKELVSALQAPERMILGESEVMQEVFRTVEKVAPTDANVLILGENGTGKDLLARQIHKLSQRSEEVFISVDLGSITETLFESELFGHKKGAFTDAREDRKGRMELAQGGTLFLDELGNLNLSQQARLLSALQNREIFPVGASAPLPVDFRLIAATNANLDRMVEEKHFRQDLFYRIKTVEIRLPPLRERGGDIILLAVHFLQQFNKRYRKTLVDFTPDARQKLRDHSWPGNIRELQHCVERAVIMAERPYISARELLLEQPVPANMPVLNNQVTLEELEIHTIRQALQKNRGNISAAAKELGLTRAALYRRIEKYGL